MLEVIKANITGKRILGLSLLALFIPFIVWLQSNYVDITPEVLRVWILSFGWYAPFVFLLAALIRPLVFFPITIYYLASGLAFGAFWGGVIAVLGATISAFVAHIIADKTGTRLIKDVWAEKISGVKKRVENRGFQTMLLIRLIPMVSFDLISYAAGLAKIRLGIFLLATMIGVLPRVFAYTFVGSSILDIGSYQFWLALSILLVIFLIPVFLFKKSGKEQI